MKQGNGDTNGALADFNKIIEIKPDNAVGYFNRGTFKSSNGDTNGAQADFKKAVELNPTFRESIGTKGYLMNGTDSK